MSRHLKAIALTAAMWACACSPGDDPSTDAGKRALLDQVRDLLSQEKCAEAIELIEPVYASTNTDDDVRRARASAYACYAGVRQLNLIDELEDIDLGTKDIWKVLTLAFPDHVADRRMEAGWFAMDAWMSIWKLGLAIPDNERFLKTTYNPGSLIRYHRTDESNFDLVFSAMAVIGATNRRFGEPNTTGKQKRSLYFRLATTMDETGCGYASAVINLTDAIKQVQGAVTGSLEEALSEFSTGFGTVVENSCDYGCRGRNTIDTANVEVATCSVACGACPEKLRSRETCENDAEAKCAAAGLVRLLNEHPVLGWEDE